jgi:hypothetical protein
MAGTIGLCNSGKWLDRQFVSLLEAKERRLVSKITKFINSFSADVMKIHKSMSKPDSVLLVLREHYKLEAMTRFATIPERLRIGILAYVHALTKPNFIPSTRTQSRLREKAVAAALVTMQASGGNAVPPSE